MEVRLEYTEGLGKLAEISVDGHDMFVCDGVSTREHKCPPGLLENVKFHYVTYEEFAWDEVLRGNPSRKKMIEHVRKWSYMGYGRILSVTPVVIDFSLLTMESPIWSSDEALVGRYVRVSIDRLEMSFAIAPDYPKSLSE